MGMKLTVRDQGLLRWNNGHGYVSVAHLAERMGVEFSTGARRVRALCDEGLLERRRFPASTLTVLIPTIDGCALANDHLVPIKGIRVATSRHDLLLVECAMGLERRFGCSFEPERRLRARGFGGDSHLPDGLLHRQDGRPIAVELELSQKAPARVAAIMDAHAANFDIAEVWYIVVDDTMKRFITRCSEGYAHVKVVTWKPASLKSADPNGGARG